VSVEREGALLRKVDKVKAIEVDLDQDNYRAEVVKGRLTCMVAHCSGASEFAPSRLGSARSGLRRWPWGAAEWSP